jgi:hypothetical protein
VQVTSPCSGCTPEYAILTDAYGSLKGGPVENTYSAVHIRTDCAWIIAPTGARQVIVKINSRTIDYALEPWPDVVKLYQCQNVTCQKPRLLNDLSWRYSDTIVSEIDAPYILLHQPVKGGFYATWDQVERYTCLHS